MKQSEKPKPELFNPYELKPPVQCFICGTVLYDKRHTRLFMGHRCCRSCAKGSEYFASYDNI